MLEFLSDIQKKVIHNEVPEEIFEQEIERWVRWILTHKYEVCLTNLINEWMPRLKERLDSIPTNDEALAELILSQPDYKNKSTRNKEEEAILKAKESEKFSVS